MEGRAHRRRARAKAPFSHRSWDKGWAFSASAEGNARGPSGSKPQLTRSSQTTPFRSLVWQTRWSWIHPQNRNFNAPRNPQLGAEMEMRPRTEKFGDQMEERRAWRVECRGTCFRLPRTGLSRQEKLKEVRVRLGRKRRKENEDAKKKARKTILKRRPWERRRVQGEADRCHEPGALLRSGLVMMQGTWGGKSRTVPAACVPTTLKPNAGSGLSFGALRSCSRWRKPWTCCCEAEWRVAQWRRRHQKKADGQSHAISKCCQKQQCRQFHLVFKEWW